MNDDEFISNTEEEWLLGQVAELREKIDERNKQIEKMISIEREKANIEMIRRKEVLLEEAWSLGCEVSEQNTKEQIRYAIWKQKHDRG